MLRGWGGEEANLVSGVGTVVRGAESSRMMSWYGGWLGYWACQKFQVLEIMPTTEERMYDFQFFSRWHNLSLVYILFNDSGNSSLFNHFLIRDVRSFSSTRSGDRTYVHRLRRHPCFRNTSAFPFSRSYLKRCK